MKRLSLLLLCLPLAGCSSLTAEERAAVLRFGLETGAHLVTRSLK